LYKATNWILTRSNRCTSFWKLANCSKAFAQCLISRHYTAASCSCN